MNRAKVLLLMLLAAEMLPAQADCPPPLEERAAEEEIRAGALKIIRSPRAETAACWVGQGRAAYRRGDWEAAYQAFSHALGWRQDAVEAWLGLAAAALKLGRRDMAEHGYHQALALSPDEPLALAGLAVLHPQDERLLAALEQAASERSPTAWLYAVLGDLYARRNDWPRAQQAYFHAHRIDLTHPDYSYDLAVTLDHLGQYRLARSFYTEALQLARQRKAAFDPEVAARRLRQLEEMAR
ncbi:hypothetical protein MIT9_P0042 [Methylomarinovum caldicuralii]|uniref:Tetratricopeptide repeat protein n=1 Tax=Methylomarinovum caldicuralii TaxID=438856 RepID=A0AAU9C0B1_9GAMM|nr:tetratricopeptide repeat protein [Methylomarinovum caldicuralii]BCX80469.1 hypothetical protein MIT9_P0042 [Methylomarinovum caldicuralii]